MIARRLCQWVVQDYNPFINRYTMRIFSSVNDMAILKFTYYILYLFKSHYYLQAD